MHKLPVIWYIDIVCVEIRIHNSILDQNGLCSGKLLNSQSIGEIRYAIEMGCGELKFPGS